MEVEQLSVDRCWIDFEVSGVDDCAGGSLNRECVGVDNRMRDVKKLDAETADFNLLLRRDRVEVSFIDNSVLFQFALDQSHA